MSKLPDDLQKLQASREGVYGPHKWNMIGTSMQICGMLVNRCASCGKLAGAQDLLDLERGGKMDDIAPAILAIAVKGNRIASGNYHEDNFKDYPVYLSFVEEMQKQEAKE